MHVYLVGSKKELQMTFLANEVASLEDEEEN